MENPEACVGCAFCALTCPDIAITVYREKKNA
jgi:2-oxoglutarate ferredoxin oxidoreductase subunit delta